MPAATAQCGGTNGSDRLLAHCSALSRLDQTRPSAFQRLEDEVGDDLARLLLAALTPRQPQRIRR